MGSMMHDAVLIVVTSMLTLTVVAVVWLAGSIRLLLEEMERTRARRRR
jgi:hypothetical protein